jgi:hypothetical protein
MTNPEQKKLGIVAGDGHLPALLIAACRGQNRPYTVIAIQGAAQPDLLGEDPALWMRLGAAANGFTQLRSDGVECVVLAGKVKRPSFKDLMPDWRTAKFIARVGTRAFTERHSVGDDKFLRAVVAEIETDGFVIVGVDTVLPELIAKGGPIGEKQPTAGDFADISVGFQAAKDLGQKDIGQAVVVQNGAVICKESETGTDALITAAGARKAAGPGPILVKTAKPGQDRRVDLPAIGVETIMTATEAGFRGIAIEADNTLILGRAAVAVSADEKGLFVVAVDGSEWTK